MIIPKYSVTLIVVTERDLIMKNIIFVTIFLLFITDIFYADEDLYSGDYEYDYGINVGVMGIGISSDKLIDGGYFYGHFLDFIYQSEIGFGFDVSPLSSSWSVKDTTSDLSLTFVNATVFYDLLKKNKNFVLGPFTTVHMLGNKQLDYFGLQSGLLFSLRQFDDDSILCFNYINVELGYSYINGTSAFYAQVGIDAIGVIIFLSWGSQQAVDDYKKNNNE